MADSTEATMTRTLTQATSVEGEAESLDVLQILSRQRWLISFLTIAGLTAGILYALTATVWYQSSAKVLINQRTAGLGSDTTATEIVEEDVLANHIELISSRRIVVEALEENDLMDLPSIVSKLPEDADVADYVIDHLEIIKGGDGSAKSAQSLRLTLSHTDPEDTQLVLSAVLKRYETFIVDQVEQVMGRANQLVNQAKDDIETELASIESDFLKSRQEAPLYFEGEGSSNVYQDRYRRLQEELLDIDIQESSVRTRLERVQTTLADMDRSTNPIDHLDKLALIDSESLERLGVFAGLQTNASESVEFKAAMPAKMEEARTQMTTLLQLNSEKQRLESVFGAGHPKVQEINNQIRLVKQFLQDNQELTSLPTGLSETTLTPEGLLRAYTGFLQHDLAALAERRRELVFLIEDAEKKAKELIEFELKDLVFQKKIARQESLFNGVVTQLQELDTASGLSGYLYEFLEVPRVGEKSWPRLPLCGLGGMLLGMFSGLFLAVANDVRDGRFRSAAELDDVIGLPSLGRIGKVNSIRDGVKGLVAAELSPDAEAFRLGRTVLLPKIRAGELRVLGFTSPMQGDGKSTVTSNFAVSFTQIGLKTIVIDGDLRRPSMHKYFSVPRENGMCDLLGGTMDLETAIKRTSVDNVDIITSGSGTNQPAELLQSARFDEILKELTEMYDVVLVDMPPVLAVSDPVVMMPRLDGAVLVVRVATVRRDEVVNSMRRLRACGGSLVGCMLNTFGAGKKFDSDGGYYGYYKSDYTQSRRPATPSVLPSRPSISPSPSESGANGKVPH